MHVNEIVTQKIIKQLEKGKLPWNKQWIGGQHQNISTGHVYSGINPWLLNDVAEENGYKSNYWITQKEMIRQGGRVSKDIYFDRDKHGFVVFSGNVKKSKKVLETQHEDMKKTYFMLRYYKVYNIDTVEGIDFEIPEKLTGELPEPEAIIKDYPVTMLNGGDRAAYSIQLDTIRLPKKELFESLEGYYSVVFHEMVHSTGHETRLKRLSKDDQTSFGSESYSKEELIAELGSAFLMNHCKLDQLKQSAAYIQGWLKPLKSDPQMIISASSQAQKAYDYILGDK